MKLEIDWSYADFMIQNWIADPEQEEGIPNRACLLAAASVLNSIKALNIKCPLLTTDGDKDLMLSWWLEGENKFVVLSVTEKDISLFIADDIGRLEHRSSIYPNDKVIPESILSYLPKIIE